MDGGNGNITGLLERIVAAQEATTAATHANTHAIIELRAGQEALERWLRRIAEGQDALRGEVREVRDGLTGVNGRLDNALRFMGAYRTDHEERIRALEEVVFKPSGT